MSFEQFSNHALSANSDHNVSVLSAYREMIFCVSLNWILAEDTVKIGEGTFVCFIKDLAVLVLYLSHPSWWLTNIYSIVRNIHILDMRSLQQHFF